MYIPTIYNKDIDETSHALTLNDDKLHHLRNVLRVKNNSPIKISNGRGLMYFGKFKDNVPFGHGVKLIFTYVYFL